MKLPKKADAMVGGDKGLDDSEEGFLNPEDLSIIDEKTWEPSDEEILSYALKLGYDIEKDPDELFEVAYYYMKYPLPEGWKRAIYKKTKELMYINMEDGEIEVVTEIEEMAHQMYLEKKEEMLGKQLGLLDKEDKKDTKTPASTKIPPLNPVKKSTSPGKTPSSLPPLKDKSGSKNNLFNDIENELLDKKKEKDELGFDIDLDFDKYTDKKKNNNDDIFGISQKPIVNSDNKEKDKDKDKDKEKDNEKDKEKGNFKEKNDKKDNGLYGMQAEESEEENEYGDEFDYDGIDDDDSDLNKGEPLIKSMINKEKEKEEKEKKEKEDKEKREEELKEKEEKEKKEREEKEKREKEEKEKKEKERKEKEEKERREKELKEKEEREKRTLLEKLEKEKMEKEKREREEREEKLRKELEKEKELKNKLIKDKKEYLEKKIKELQKYKDQKKSQYEKSKKDIEEKKQKLTEEYKSKLQKNINKTKSKLESQFSEKLELYESQLENKKSKEERKYADEQKISFEEKQKNNKKRKEKEYEEEKNKLKEKKEKLLKEINQEKKERDLNESNIKEKKIKLQHNLKLIEESKISNKNNKTKNYELAIKDYESKSEKKLIKDKEQLRETITNNSNLLNYNSSSSNLNFSMSGINKEDDNNDLIKSKLMENIQKSLNEEYEINCKEIEIDLNKNKLKDIEKYKLSMETEKLEKINFYKNEILLKEKEYYKALSSIRKNTQKKKLDGDSYLNVGFEETMTQLDQTKNKISQDNKKLVGLVIEGIQKLIIQNNTAEQTEIHVEEFLRGLNDTYHIMFQKNKNVYEMSEYDYNHKKLFIKYLLEVINYLSKIFSSSNTDPYEIDKKYIAENLLKFCKDKINDYKLKFQNKKKKRIYSFLNDKLLSKENSYSYLAELNDTKETNTIFVNSFKRKYENDNINIDNNEEGNILNKINVNESINNINKNSFNFKSNNNLIASMNNLQNLNPFNNLNKPNTFSNSHGFNTLQRTKSTNDYNINEQFLRLINRGKNLNKLEYFTIDQNKNWSIPIIPEKILENLDENILSIYSEIILFLKNEYLKLAEIMDENNKENNLKKNKKSINLNLLILDKIKIYTEETFNYLINNYQNQDQYRNIRKKIQIVQNHIDDFKKNFNIDKYLENPNFYKTTSSIGFGKRLSEEDVVNNRMNFNGQSYNKNENENNGMNNLILNGNFNGFQTK